nr:unnamed protein product [Callosobruchus analis]CAI5859688.1 unnamed protein product [Callosobruchus analis]
MDGLLGLRLLENLEEAELLANESRRKFFRRHNAFEELNENTFIKMFRLTKELALTLINSLDEYLVAPTRKSAIDKQTKVGKLSNRLFIKIVLLLLFEI